MGSAPGSLLLRALCTFALSALAEQATAVDVYGTAGGGNDVGVYEVGLSWAPWKTWPVDPNWSLSLSPTAGVALWHASDAVANKSLVDFEAVQQVPLGGGGGGITTAGSGAVATNGIFRTQ